MRGIVFLSGLVVLAVLFSGCSQCPPCPAPVPVPPPGTTPVTGTMTGPHPVMHVRVTATETQDSVIIRVVGGRDAALLSALNVRIDNFDDSVIERTIPSPAVGEPYRIGYYHMANAETVNVVGAFSDGFQQTLLLTSVEQGTGTQSPPAGGQGSSY